MKIPAASGFLGTALYVILFVSPYVILNWLYFRLGKTDSDRGIIHRTGKEH